MALPEVAAPEGFSYSPSSWPEQITPQPLEDVVTNSIARLESLKIKLMKVPMLSLEDREALFHELDLLRSSFIDISSSQYRSTFAAALSPAGEGGAMQPLAEHSFSYKDDLIIEGIIGNSPAITHILKIISNVAPSTLAVLLEGETGTGKELFARIIHLNSGRSKFIPVNCGAFPPGVIESELFGHVKGAFTGATSDRKGKFEEAHEGTIFLDEIGELEPFAQVKLLRVLEVGEIQRVGSDQSRTVNVRVIAATNRNLEAMVKQGKFREDLYFRINMCPVFLPPLRERRDEIPILLEYFIEEACARQNKPIPQIDPALRHFLHQIYDFRGNIRELKNIAQYISCMGGSKPVTREDLPLRVGGEIANERPITGIKVVYEGNGRHDATAQDSMPPEDTGAATKGRTAVLKRAESYYWSELLKKHHGNIKGVCDETGLSSSRVYQILEKFKLKAKEFRGAE